MTAIVAFKHNDKVYLAGDRLASNNWTKHEISRPKVFRVSNNLYFGYTSSFYMGQLLEFSFNIPSRSEGISDDKYIFTEIVPKLREMFESKDFGKKKHDKDNEPDLGTFIMVYKSRIFIFQNNASLLEVEHAGVGCGGQDVMSSILTAMTTIENVLPEYLQKDSIIKIIETAYQHCSDYMCGVSAKHDILIIGE